MMLLGRRSTQSHLPLLDVFPHVFELMEAQFAGAVTLKGLELKALTYRCRLDVLNIKNKKLCSVFNSTCPQCHDHIYSTQLKTNK